MTPSYETALEAARRGDWPTARLMLADLAETADSPSVQALLASVCFAMDDGGSAERAADRALTLDARNLRAALVKADLLAARGARREANVYYRAVVELGRAQTSEALPDDLADGVRRAAAVRDALARDLFSHIREELEQAGYSEHRSSERFTHAIDLATGRRTAYFQQPQAFYFPELPNTQFYPRDDFPWLDVIEAATDEITAELEAVIREDAGFVPYLQTIPDMPSRTDYPLIDSMDWSASFLWRDGAETPTAARCPRTMAALANAPLCRIAGRSPQIMFSQLRAGAHIQPHHGFVNTRLICHLPLLVPGDCRFRVGNEVRSWERGKAWVFDDTIEHEAINQSAQTRVVLIFDIWRPELTEEERSLVTTLLESMDAFSPKTTSWD